MGWLYTRLVMANSGLVDYTDDAVQDLVQNGTSPADENTALLSKSASAQLSLSVHEFMAM